MSNAARCTIKICYLDEQTQLVKPLIQPPGTTIARAVTASGILPTLGKTLEDFTLAIHGQKQTPDAIIQNGDRIELLRPVNPAAQKLARQRKQDKK